MKNNALLVSSLSFLLAAGLAPSLYGNTGNVVTDTPVMTDVNSHGDILTTNRVKQALKHDSRFTTSFSDVTVVTKDGVVTLSGTVADSASKADFENAVSQVPGVRRVDNQLSVK